MGHYRNLVGGSNLWPANNPDDAHWETASVAG